MSEIITTTEGEVNIHVYLFVMKWHVILSWLDNLPHHDNIILYLVHQ